ncbi:poly(R)-hydroxyalkanoic acid synthase subunit PhaE [Spiribacter vilamensis]|uniref:Poly(3-hydroxyalkanoate) polymerase subunit PhaE n=1 Tax=Spiribacter vilamensis TaxID=531306 RepID=A0A4V2GJ64_9GAMM|nr:poly(R)-hydroxyalkanoic acid synthase subunit PhaE [Spiribacter vilamensis]RZU99055.1 poly(hydroxyalkanoate) synthase III subunit E [Spiribacter vilamensis]TVO61946.1 hypothetical protein FPL09_07545 [Spiribacter vilamensis]
MVSDESGEQGGSDRDVWAAWLGGFASPVDPLGVRGLLIRSAEALEDARTPAEAIQALSDAIEGERARREAHGEQLETLLEQWSKTLQIIAPAFPDTRTTDFPSLGPYPRHQTRLRELAEQVDGYQAALARHLEAITDLGERCIADLQAELGDQPPTRVDPAWLAERWSAIAEPRYETWLAQPETQDRIADLVNAWSAVAQTLRGFADDCLEGLGLPSGRGMDDIAAELQRQRRRQRRETAALRAEIATLRRELHGSGESAI